MSANPRGILAIDLLVAAQCFGFWERLSSSTALMKVKAVLAEGVSFYDKNRYFGTDIEHANQLLLEALHNWLMSAEP